LVCLILNKLFYNQNDIFCNEANNPVKCTYLDLSNNITSTSAIFGREDHPKIFYGGNRL